jgi:hypothetical protein
MTDRSGAYRVLVGKPEGKRPLGRSRHKWEYNMKVDIQDTRLIDLVQDTGNWQDLVNAVMKLRFP